MYRAHPAALMTLLALSVTSLAGAQQASSDTAQHAKTSSARDQRQDRRTIAADSTKLHHDLAVRDSVRSTLEADHDRTHAATLRVDSLRAVLAAAQKTPRDSAAIMRDRAALERAKTALDQDLDRAKREDARLAAIQKKVDQESDATIDARRDLRADRSTSGPAPTGGRDQRQDARTIAADSTRLHREIAIRDSVRSVLEADHDRTHAATLRVDSLQAALAAARKASPRDSMAVARDVAALNQAKQALDRDLDRGKREQAQLASINRTVSRESDATIDARRDLRADRSGAEHSSPKSHRR